MLRAGDWVEVRSKAEILGTLDGRGRLDDMPFMPEMFQFCGQRFQVWKRAHKTCDTVNRTGGRRVANAVHLQELRCDGAAHGGCEAACLLFWNTAWLKAVDGAPARITASTGCTEAAVLADTMQVAGESSAPLYSCQATLLPQFTRPLPWWDIRQYLEDFTSGNVTLRQLLTGGIYVLVYGFIGIAGSISTRLSYLLTRGYDWLQSLYGGVPYPRRRGTIPTGSKTPSRSLNLQPGEVVHVLPYRQVLATLNSENRNRGMFFDAEEVPYCGKTLRVRNRVNRIVNERTGAMIELQGDSVILQDAWCQGRYSDRRMHCPRAIFPIWKEVWLERAGGDTSQRD